MTADTYSSQLGFLQMATGNDVAAWGTNAILSVFTLFERAIAGTVTHDVTGGTLDLSASPPPAGPTQAAEFSHVFTGALLSNQVVLVPNLLKFWSITNNTTGNFTLRIKTAGGGGTIVPQGLTVPVACLGSNIMSRIGARTGHIFMYGGASPPPGAALCNGAVLSRTDYDELYAKLGTTWGAGDGFTTFNLPNLTNRFPRGSGGSLPVGTLQGHQVGSHAHTGAVAISGTTGTESAYHSHNVSFTTGIESATHTHAYTQPVAGGLEWGAGNVVASTTKDATTGSTTGAVSADHAHYVDLYSGAESGVHAHNISGSYNFTTNDAGSGETRPYSSVVLMCVWL